MEERNEEKLSVYPKIAAMMNSMNYKFKKNFVYTLESNNYFTVEGRGKSLIDVLKSMFDECDPSEIKSNIKNYGYIEMVLDFSSEVEREYPYFFFKYGGWEILASWIPKNYKDFSVREKYSDCKSRGEMATYFEGEDIFRIFSSDIKVEIKRQYSGDYYDYVNENYSLEKRVEMYMSYLELNAMNLKVNDNSWNDPRYFVATFRKQVALYYDIIKQNAVLGYRIIGDGPGTASIACILLGVKYTSMEPNKIGAIAKSLKIITEENKSEVLEGDYCLFLGNVMEYVDLSGFIRSCDKAIVVEESREFKGMNLMKKVENSDRLVWTKGIEISHYNRIANCYNYLKNREPICPLDVKSKVYCEERNLSIRDGGFKVSYRVMDVAGVMCIRDMSFPANLSYSRNGEMKVDDGFKFKYSVMGQFVVTNSKMYEYYPKEVGSSRILEEKDYRMSSGYYIAIIKNPRRIIKIREGDRLMPAYYIATVERSGRKESYFRTTNLGVTAIVGGMTELQNLDQQ